MRRVVDGKIYPVSSRPGPVAAEALAENATQGLTAAEAERRLEVDGPNELVEARGPSIWLLISRQLANTMTAVLAVA